MFDKLTRPSDLMRVTGSQKTKILISLSLDRKAMDTSRRLVVEFLNLTDTFRLQIRLKSKEW